VALLIVHRQPTTEPIPAGAAVWRTCLREIAFLGSADGGTEGAVATGGQQLVEADAYRVLLEILCGLQSPMVGETQVMGQFKSFLSTLGREGAELNRLGQRLLTDARDVRAKHLQGLGSRSYGSAIRRYIGTCSHAAVIGTGKLAQEVLPFLAGDGQTVDQWGRANDAGPDLDRVTYRQLDSLDTCPRIATPTVLVVAAPVESELVEHIAERYGALMVVVDLRADVCGRSPAVAAPLVALQDLFDGMRASQATAVPHIDAARAEIAWRSHRYEMRDQLRPFGWEDLCA
jgi:glutamyl-tRNA reductase